MIAIALLLAAGRPVVTTVMPSQAPPAPRQTTDAEFCEAMRKVVDGIMTEVPKMIDASTRLDGMSVLCSVRGVMANKTVMANMSDMQEGWQARKQAQWNHIICDNAAFGPMARRGWNFGNAMVFRSGERVVHYAECRGPPAK